MEYIILGACTGNRVAAEAVDMEEQYMSRMDKILFGMFVLPALLLAGWAGGRAGTRFSGGCSFGPRTTGSA